MTYSLFPTDRTARVDGVDPDNPSPTELVLENSVVYNGVEYTVTSIRDYAFKDCSSLASVTIPSAVTSIGVQVFYGCSSLESIIIPEGVTSIGNLALGNCRSLASVTIPSTVTSIGISVFSGCTSLESIAFPEGVTSSGYNAFWGCSNLLEIRMGSAEPPFLGTSALYNLPDTYLIYVPVGCADTYRKAAGWSSYAVHIVEDVSVAVSLTDGEPYT